MPELQLLTADHGPAVLAFELANRDYFTRTINDRGDEYFTEFESRFDDLLTDQQAGGCANYVLVDDDGSVLGRFNLYGLGGSAVVGYRMAERAAGRGLATSSVRRLCRLAAVDHGVSELRAAASDANVASQRVLIKAGFEPTGPTVSSELGGRPGTWFELTIPPVD